MILAIKKIKISTMEEQHLKEFKREIYALVQLKK